MQLKQCERCIWFGQCEEPVECDDFTPLVDDVDADIERERIDFRQEWWEYVLEMQETLEIHGM